MELVMILHLATEDAEPAPGPGAECRSPVELGDMLGQRSHEIDRVLPGPALADFLEMIPVDPEPPLAAIGEHDPVEIPALQGFGRAEQLAVHVGHAAGLADVPDVEHDLVRT